MIPTQCPACQQPLTCPPETAGQLVSCPRCRGQLRVPAAAEATAGPRLSTEGRDNPFADLVGEGAADAPAPSRRSARVSVPAAHARLGRPIAEYRMAWRWVWAVVGCLLLLPCGGLGAAMLVSRPRPPAQVPEEVVPRRDDGPRRIALAACSTGLGLVLAAGLCAVSAYRVLRRVVVCENGFLDISPVGTTALAWDEIAAVYQSITRVYVNGQYSKTVYRYTVEPRRGARRTFGNGLESVSTLGKRLMFEAARANRPRAVAEFNEGRWVEFGRVRLSRQGVEFDGDRLGWDRVEEVGAAQGELIIRERFRKDAWAHCPVAQVPNLPLFVELVGMVVG